MEKVRFCKKSVLTLLHRGDIISVLMGELCPAIRCIHIKNRGGTHNLKPMKMMRNLQRGA